MTPNEEIKNKLSNYKGGVIQLRCCSGFLYTGMLQTLTDNIVLLEGTIMVTSPDGTLTHVDPGLMGMAVLMHTIETVLVEH